MGLTVALERGEAEPPHTPSKRDVMNPKEKKDLEPKEPDLQELESLEEWKEFTDIQKKVILKHFFDPEKTKQELSKDLGISRATIYQVFNSKYFERMNIELANMEKRDLLQLAVRTLRKLMIDSRSDMVKLAACTKVLEDAEVLGQKVKQKANEKILVVWNTGGDKNIVQPISGTEGNTRLRLSLQGNRGGTEIRENNPGG